MYILTDAKDVAEMYKIKNTLSFDQLLFDMMKVFGLPQVLVEKMFQRTAGSPVEKCTMHLIHDWQKEQTQGKGLHSIRERVVEDFKKNLALCHFVPQRSYVILATDQKAIVSCKKWTAEIVLNAFQSAYFGDSLYVIDPGLSQCLVKFDELSWQMFYQFPRLLSREMHRYKERVTESFRVYLETPIEQRAEAAYFSQRLEKQYRSLGFSNQEMASLFTVTYWGYSQIPPTLASLRAAASYSDSCTALAAIYTKPVSSPFAASSRTSPSHALFAAR